jgi:hypothetical protein
MDDDILNSLKLIEHVNLIRSSSVDSSIDSSIDSYNESMTSSGRTSPEDIFSSIEMSSLALSASRDLRKTLVEGECIHRIIEESGNYFCDFCGNEFTGNISYDRPWETQYSSVSSSSKRNGVFTKVSYISIKDDLKFMGLNEDVLIDIFETYKKVTDNGSKIHRSKLRKSILCACVKHVFDTRKISCDENELIKQFEIDKKDYSKGFKELRMKVSETRCCQDDVLISLRNLYRKFDIDRQFFQTIESIYKTVKSVRYNYRLQAQAQETFDEGPIFKDKNAKTIAAVVMYYWLENRSNARQPVIDINSFSVECLIPKNSLHKAYRDCSPLISRVLHGDGM